MATGKDLAAAIRGYGQAFYDRSRQPIGGNNLNIRWGDMLPYYGAGLGYDDARQQYEQGDVGAAALTAGMTAIPWGSLMRKGGGALREMTGYHGTPHKFDEFKMDKIGTGEGAQAYGHGLYFAGEPTVAKQYQRNLARDTEVSQETEAMFRQIYGKEAVIDRIHFPNAKDLQNSYQTGLLVKRGEIPPELAERFDAAPKRGNLYKADLPEDHELLDWDKPLGGQRPSLVGKLKPLAEQFEREMPGNEFSKAFAERASGQQVYQALIKTMGGDQASAAKHASDMLRDAGIPGLKYLDQGSRGAGKGTSNYVIWDEQRIKHMGEADK